MEAYLPHRPRTARKYLFMSYSTDGKMFLIFLSLLTLFLHKAGSQISDLRLTESTNDNLGDAIQFLRDYDREAAEMCNRVASSEWKYATNATEFNKRRMREQQNLAAKFECLSWRRAASFDSSTIVDTSIRRQLGRIVQPGRCGLGEDKHAEITHVISLMKENYNSAKVCPFQGPQATPHKSASYVSGYSTYCDLRIEPDLVQIMQTSRVEPELNYFWSTWRDKTGPPIKNTFMRYLDLANQAAERHGFSDAGEQMRSLYDDNDFFFTVNDLWTKIQPLYRQLVTFVRKGLVRQYGENVVRKDGPLPAHLLGNMWAQNWRNILDLVKPGQSETPDVTGEMIRQGYTPLKIFQTAEEFFTSIGLSPMTPEFWRNSMLQKSNEIHGQCTASAWDFCNKIDFRIKQCTQVNLEDFVNAHHEMTHVHYYMQYASQPYLYREGPNPAFHEAVANAVSLCVGGPVHLQKLGLLNSPVTVSNGNNMINIEYLLSVALDKLPFMSFSLALEKWRWYVFEKGPTGMNARWWELRLRYQGIIPPTARGYEHFDAGAKYHVISDQDYIKYFVATVLQFHIFSELCIASHHVGPLHTCDYYRSREAGRIISDIMQQGASLSSSQLIKLYTRGKTAQLTVEPLLKFFRPLEAWLEVQNRDEPLIGWSSRMEDYALFQPMMDRNGRNSAMCTSFNILAMITFSFSLFNMY
ncbi:angiotensin-converting enzyme-like isoform X2 [Toxorhynchites rutilus septentrionalis]|uniref:angiotensin-converting enzyme-like isoform X2 n=1 Tax=Toxorhynchites rutilus septentrionalis TaxID=329112 RepID=UPI0024785397|nr:angiotensin-converting enzyme-like isoform X2 [Toxorhynchites rutilus septentrionalis]